MTNNPHSPEEQDYAVYTPDPHWRWVQDRWQFFAIVGLCITLVIGWKAVEFGYNKLFIEPHKFDGLISEYCKAGGHVDHMVGDVPYIVCNESPKAYDSSANGMIAAAADALSNTCPGAQAIIGVMLGLALMTYVAQSISGTFKK